MSSISSFSTTFDTSSGVSTKAARKALLAAEALFSPGMPAASELVPPPAESRAGSIFEALAFFSLSADSCFMISVNLSSAKATEGSSCLAGEPDSPVSSSPSDSESTAAAELLALGFAPD